MLNFDDPDKIIVAGTGHRPNKLGGYSEFAHGRLVTLAKDWLLQIKVDEIISGMALGWDTALAEAAIDLKIPFVAAIPFVGQEAHWPDESQLKYHDIIKKSRKLVVVSKGDFTSAKMQIRNEWMVDNCTYMVALWDGTYGGTSNCIQYAESKNKTIINLYDKWIMIP